MLKKIVILLLALSTVTLAQTAHADDTAALAQQTYVKVATLKVVHMPIETVTRKTTTRRIVAIKPKPQSQATRVKSHGRFVIGTDNSNSAMTVYRSKNTRKAMPNLFKN